MSEENMNVVRSFYEALDRADLEAMLELTDPAIRIHDPDLPGGGEFSGREQAREFLTGWRGSWDEYPVELADGHLLTLRDGRVVHLRTYLSQVEALEAAGLSG